MNENKKKLKISETQRKKKKKIFSVSVRRKTVAIRDAPVMNFAR